MKSTDKKTEFIELRAQGKSYRAIAEELEISKSTCERWEKELRAKVAERKEERAEEIYNLYAIDRASRIERLGKTVKRIESALQAKDFDEIPADTLLKLLLSYQDALKAEHIEPTGALQLPEKAKEGEDIHTAIINALSDLYEKQERGEVTPAQAKSQLQTISALLTAHNEKQASDISYW